MGVCWNLGLVGAGRLALMHLLSSLPPGRGSRAVSQGELIAQREKV